MLPADAPTTRPSNAPATLECPAQPTVCDLNRDGLADVLFGTGDGRLVAYETRKPFRTADLLWPTANGNFRRTGSRIPPTFDPRPAPPPAGAPITVTVIDAATRRPLRAAALTASVDAGEIPFHADDGDGVIRLGRISPIAVWVAKAGYATVRVDLTGKRAADRAVTVALPPAAPVGGFVRDGDGRPIVNARVFLTATGSTPDGHAIELFDAPATTDEHGHWTVRTAPAHCDAFYLRIEHPSFASLHARVGRTPETRAALYARRAVTILLPASTRESE